MRSRFLTVVPICLLVLGIFTLPSHTFAVSESAISLTAIPSNPAPGETVLVTASSYVSNLDAVSISWFVNGKKVTSGFGQKSVSFAASATGSDTTVRAVISLPDGETERQITLRPSFMVLLYEATDAYVPPFYRGKALPSIGSDIKIVALPEMKSGAGLVNPKNMVYDWTRNYTNEADASGYGKNSLIYTNDFLEDSETIGVTASTTDGQYSLKGFINVQPSDIKISFYKNDSTLGTLWEEAIADGHLITGDEILVAEPYFITPKQIQTPRLVWNWFINDGLINVLGGYKRNVIPLRVENGISGTAQLKLEIENKDDLLETAEKEITVEF